MSTEKGAKAHLLGLRPKRARARSRHRDDACQETRLGRVRDQLAPLILEHAVAVSTIKSRHLLTHTLTAKRSTHSEPNEQQTLGSVGAGVLGPQGLASLPSLALSSAALFKRVCDNTHFDTCTRAGSLPPSLGLVVAAAVSPRRRRQRRPASRAHTATLARTSPVDLDRRSARWRRHTATTAAT